MGLSDCGTAVVWDCGIVRLLDCGRQGAWECGSVGVWDCGIVDPSLFIPGDTVWPTRRLSSETSTVPAGESGEEA